MKGILVIIMFVGALVSIQFFALPMVTDIRAQWADIADMKKIIQTAEDTKDDRAKYLGRLSEVRQDDIRRLGLLVPSKVASEDLYVFLNNIIKDAGLDAKTISIADVGAKQSDKQTNKELPFDISISGRYSDIRELLTTMEDNLRLMDVDTLKITSADASGGQSSSYALVLQGKFYYAGN